MASHALTSRRVPELAPLVPRLVNEETAAAYLGIGKTKFRRKWQKGDAPAPHRDGGRLLWDVRLLDRHVDRLSGLSPSPGGWDV